MTHTERTETRRVAIAGREKAVRYDPSTRELYWTPADSDARRVVHRFQGAGEPAIDDVVTEFEATPPRPKHPCPQPSHQEPASIETFYENIEMPGGAIMSTAVRLARVPADVPVTTGQLYPGPEEQTLVLYSTRRVHRPAEGYRYFEYRTR